jgi:hypothetical protein
MTEQPMRAPTVDEAVAFLMLPTTRRYRRRCIEHWRELSGQAFAETVERRVRAKFKERHEIT